MTCPGTRGRSAISASPVSRVLGTAGFGRRVRGSLHLRRRRSWPRWTPSLAPRWLRRWKVVDERPRRARPGCSSRPSSLSRDRWGLEAPWCLRDWSKDTVERKKAEQRSDLHEETLQSAGDERIICSSTPTVAIGGYINATAISELVLIAAKPRKRPQRRPGQGPDSGAAGTRGRECGSNKWSARVCVVEGREGRRREMPETGTIRLFLLHSLAGRPPLPAPPSRFIPKSRGEPADPPACATCSPLTSFCFPSFWLECLRFRNRRIFFWLAWILHFSCDAHTHPYSPCQFGRPLTNTHAVDMP